MRAALVDPGIGIDALSPMRHGSTPNGMGNSSINGKTNMSTVSSAIEEKNLTLQEYDPLECPICEKERMPSSVNADGSVTYVCKVDQIWQEGKPLTSTHTQAYSWRISVEGDLMEKRGSRWAAV